MLSDKGAARAAAQAGIRQLGRDRTGLQLERGLGQADLLLWKSGSQEKSQDKGIIKRTVKSCLPTG